MVFDEKDGVKTPRVSVLIPVYNREKVLAETIESVLGQTFTDFELLVCDDCSTDRSVEIIESFDDPRIRLIRNESNLGSSVSRNKLIGEARGEFFALLDSDDVAYPYRLKTQVDYLDAHPDVDACAGATVSIDGESREQGQVWYKKGASHEDLKVRTLFQCAMAQTTLMFRRRQFLEAGITYLPGPANDMGIYKYALHKLKFVNQATHLVKYRIWPSQMTSERDKQRARALEHLDYQYELLGIVLSESDRNVLRTTLDGRIPTELADDFKDLATRIVEANRSKQIYDQTALVSYLVSKYRRSIKPGSKKGVGRYIRFVRKWKSFKKMLTDM